MLHTSIDRLSDAAERQEFQAQFQAPVGPVIAGMAIAGLVLSVLPCPSVQRAGLDNLAILLWAAAGIGWWLASRRPALARWLIVLTILGLVAAAERWLVLPGMLVLLGAPMALAPAMIGTFSAFALSMAASAWLLLGPGPWYTPLPVALAAIWACLAAALATHLPRRNIGSALWPYFQHARQSLAEAQERRAELEQALADLAHANRQLALANDRLDAMRLVAQEAERSKAAFVAKVSHEFRTPLNMIIGLIDLLTETPQVYKQPLPALLLEDLDIVRRNCEHLSSMINDVLDLSQAEAGRLALHWQRVDLAAVIGDAIAVVRPMLEKKQLSCGVDIDPDLPLVYCDPTRIRQVVLNLLSNAARFTDQGGIALCAARRRGSVTVSVADTGPGISPEDAARVFEPFWTSGRCVGRQGGGSGLGLSVSKQLTELHGGRIWLESQPGRGSIFSFELWIEPPQPPEAKPARWLHEAWVWEERTRRALSPPMPVKPCILVYDAAGELLRWLRHYPEMAEFVSRADLGRAAQEAQEAAAHAILLNTPEPDDLWAAVAQVRAAVPEIPIIACSLPAAVDDALAAGTAGHLIKPVTRRALLEAIAGLNSPVSSVLIVDDDPDVQQLLERMLHSDNPALRVTAAGNGQDGINALRADPPDLVLLDIAMPVVDGWQFLEQKRCEAALSQVPVILLSAQDTLMRPARAAAALATIEGGLSPTQLIQCALSFAELLLRKPADAAAPGSPLPSDGVTV